MMVQAMGVLVAPEKIATNPRQMKRSGGAPRRVARVLPRAAPMKKSGVTSPPLKPALRVMVVKRSFQSQAHGWVFSREKSEAMEMSEGLGELTPRPRYSRVPRI